MGTLANTWLCMWQTYAKGECDMSHVGGSWNGNDRILGRCGGASAIDRQIGY